MSILRPTFLEASLLSSTRYTNRSALSRLWRIAAETAFFASPLFLNSGHVPNPKISTVS